MRPTCARTFEAEAMRDRRLGEGEQASFARHASGCAACAEEIRALERLAAALRADPAGPEDELRTKREKTRLLAAFDRALVAPEPKQRRRWLPALAAASAIAGMLVWRLHASPQPMAGTVVDATAATVWSKRSRADREEIILDHGTLSIRVTHPARRARVRPLFVVLPDGELEDTGTVFSVTAEHGTTSRVVVDEGSVTLRLRGQRPVDIRAGETWSAAPHATPPVPAERTPPLAPSIASAAPPATPPVPDPSRAFRAAMTAFDSGDHRAAAEAFARFAARYPHDSRAEDAAYLRILALQRAGDDVATRTAALEYLATYPSGFRRAEVEQLAR